MTKELSEDPRQVKRRIATNAKRGSTAKVERDKALLREQGGIRPIAEWDLEELARGKARNKNGGFNGGKPRWGPNEAEVKKEIARRLEEEARLRLHSLVYPALNRFAQLLDSADEKVAAQISTYVVDQMLGKATAKVDVQGEMSLEHRLAAALVVPGGEQAHPTLRPGEIIDGELADDDGDDLLDEAPAPRHERPSTPKQARTDPRDPEEDARYHERTVREHRQRQYGDGLDEGPDPAPPGYSRFQAWESGEDL